MCRLLRSLFFFFNDTATTEIYTLSLHDALPISGSTGSASGRIETRSAAKLYCAVRSAPRVPALCTVLPDLRKPLPVSLSLIEPGSRKRSRLPLRLPSWPPPQTLFHLCPFPPALDHLSAESP